MTTTEAAETPTAETPTAESPTAESPTASPENHATTKDLDKWLGGQTGEWIGLTWEDPPRSQGGRGATSLPEKFARQLNQLRKKPGEWGRVAIYPSKTRAYSNAQSLRKKITGYEFRPGRFDMVKDGVPMQGSGLWARYVGGPRGDNV